MKAPIGYSFRQFQEELAALDSVKPTRPDGKPLSKKELEAHRLEKAKAEFLELRVRYNWSLEDVVSFFPEEEGVGFLLKLLQEPPKKRGRKTNTE